MLTTILNLNKRVLVVDGDIFEIPEYTQMWIDDKLKFICKGEDLTEEIADDLVQESKFINYEGESGYVDYKVFPDGLIIGAKDSFISAIEANVFFWLNHNIGKPEKNDLNGSFFKMQQNFNQEKLFDQAESKTFKNPIIFSIE